MCSGVYALAVSFFAVFAQAHGANAQETSQPPATSSPASDATPSAEEAAAARDLTICAVSNDAACIGRLLSRGWAPDLLNEFGETALFAAISAGASEAAGALVRAGADTKIDIGGITPEQFALELGDPNMMSVVVTDLDQQAGALLTAAAASNDVSLMRESLSMGAEIDGRPPSEIPLHAALIADAAEALAFLIENGADPNLKSQDGLTALVVAIAGDDIPAARLLIEAGASPEEPVEGVLPLSFAAMLGSKEMVELLLDSGADPATANSDGSIPARVAQAAGEDDIAELLGGIPVDQSAELLKAIGAGNYTAAWNALRSGADPEVRDSAGIPASIVALLEGDMSIVRLLYHEDEVDLLARATDGMTALQAALSLEDPMLRMEATNYLLATAYGRGSLLDMFKGENGDSPSPGVSFATQWGEGIDPKDPKALAYLRSLASLMPDALKSALDQGASSTMPPFAAAILSGNRMSARLFGALGVAAPEMNGISLQDIARARRDWAMLYFLPGDRRAPVSLVKGASIDTKKIMQGKLRDWGYYIGEIDGIFGAGSKAAMQAYLEDRRTELLGMAEEVDGSEELSGKEISLREFPSDGNPDAATKVVIVDGLDDCQWRVMEWSDATDGRAESFVGCVRPNSGAWNGNGFGLVKYWNSGSSIELYGWGGWEDRENL